MSPRKRISFALLIAAVFLVGYALAATFTSTHVNSGVSVLATYSLSLQDDLGNSVPFLDFGSMAPGETNTVSGTLVYNSNDPASRYVVVSTVGLPEGFGFASQVNGSAISPGASLPISFSVTIPPTATPGLHTWEVILSIADGPVG